MTTTSNSKWNSRTLGDCGQWVSGGTPKKSEAAFWGGEIPWFSAKSLKTFRLEDAEDKVTELGAANGTTLVQPGTVLFVVRGMSLAKEFRVGITSTRATLNQDLRGLVPSEDIDARYLARFLRQSPDVMSHIDNASHGTKRLETNRLKSVKIPLPPLSEQKRIADILDKADAIRRKRQQGIDALDDFPHALFREMFGHPDLNEKSWPVLRFDEVTDSRLGKMLDAKHQTGKFRRPYMRNLNVQWGKLDLAEVFEMDFDADDRKEFRLQYGDVLICEGGAGVGQTAIWRNELSECYFQKSLHRVRPNPRMATPEFIAFLMWTLMKESALLRSVSSATIPHLTGIKLKQFKIPVPPLELQQEFACRIEQYTRLKEHARWAKSQNDTLFNSLVQRAFKGEL